MKDWAYAQQKQSPYQPKPELWGKAANEPAQVQGYSFGFPQQTTAPVMANTSAEVPALATTPWKSKANFADVSQATGFTKSSVKEHAFNGNPAFLQSGRGGHITGRGGRGAFGLGRGGYGNVTAPAPAPAATPAHVGHGQGVGEAEIQTPSLIAYNAKSGGGGRGGYTDRGGRGRGGYAVAGRGGTAGVAYGQDYEIAPPVAENGGIDLAALGAELAAVPGALQLDGQGAAGATPGQAVGGWQMPAVDANAQVPDMQTVSENAKMWANGGPPDGPAGW